LAERCDSCGKCVDICPTRVIEHSLSGISLEDGRFLDWYPVICDLCDGTPECARICPTGAIFIAERPEFNPVME
jgi:ferredoxin